MNRQAKVNDIEIIGENYYFNLKYKQIKCIDKVEDFLKTTNKIYTSLEFLKNCSFSYRETARRLIHDLEYDINYFIKRYKINVSCYYCYNNTFYVLDKDLTTIGQIIKNSNLLDWRIEKVKEERFNKEVLKISFYKETNEILFCIFVSTNIEYQNCFYYNFDINKLFTRYNKDDKVEFINKNGYLYCLKSGACKSSKEIVKIKSDISCNFYLDGSGREYGELKESEVNFIILNKKTYDIFFNVEDMIEEAKMQGFNCNEEEAKKIIEYLNNHCLEEVFKEIDNIIFDYCNNKDFKKIDGKFE